MRIISPAFQNGESIPEEYSRNSEDKSPPLSIMDIPPDAESLVLIMDDPDAPGHKFTHWLLFNISPKTVNLHEEVTPIVMKTGVNDYGETGYGGPNPPTGQHRYFFRLYALNTRLPLPRGATRAELEGAMRGHVLEEAILMGRFAARDGATA
jgi:Raf kinase inhibitor-like YbhB/YbcL family protein